MAQAFQPGQAQAGSLRLNLAEGSLVSFTPKPQEK
jgi:hypothetical protein